MLDEGLTGGHVGGQYTAVGFCRRYSRNVTATDAQLVVLRSQHVPHGRIHIIDVLRETTGMVVQDKEV